MKKPHAKSDKILIMAPFWEGDRWQAQTMLKLIADLQPKHSDQADILLVNRWDCKPFDKQAVHYLSRKFNLHQHKSARKEVGWPSGCNGLFFGGLEFIHHMSEAGKIPSYKAILNLASDVVPLVPDWISYLHHQWQFLPANLKHPVFAAGALLGGDHPHINGDAFLFSGAPEFLRWLVKDVNGIKVRAGWDWILAPNFASWGWANIPGIHSLWQTPTMPEIEAKRWQDNGAVLIHGVKDDSLLNFARKTLL